MQEIVSKVYWTIGEVAHKMGIATSAIRYYESEFDWIIIKRNRRGRRQLTTPLIEELQDVNFLIKMGGMTISGVRQAHEHNYIKDLVEWFTEKIDNHIYEEL